MAKPLDMPAKVTIDISGMDVGTTIQIADVKLPEGVKAAYDNNYAIVSVLMPGGDDAPLNKRIVWEWKGASSLKAFLSTPLPPFPVDMFGIPLMP